MVQTKTEIRSPSKGGYFLWFKRPPSRSVMLPLVGVGAGLVLAVAALLKPVTPPVVAVPPGSVALVNQRPILMNDFINQTQDVAGVPFAKTTVAQRSDVLHSMIDQELLVQRGLNLDLPEQSTEVRDALADAVNDITDARVLAVEPTDQELRTYYNTHRAQYKSQGTMRYEDIVLHYGGFQDADQTVEQAEADAEEAAYQLRSGATLDHVLNHFGFVRSGRSDEGNDFDFAAKLHLGAKLFAVASGIKDGQVSEPQLASDGVHIIIMYNRVPPVPADFAMSRDRVYNDYQKAEQKKAEAESLARLRRNAEILLAPGEQE